MPIRRHLTPLAALGAALVLAMPVSAQGADPAPAPASGAEAEAALAAAYGEDWHIAPYWSGEYPAGFSVVAEDAALSARTAPDPALSRTLTCALEPGRTYHPWNERSGGLEFWTAFETLAFTLSADADAYPADNDVIVSAVLREGTPARYIAYMGEGFGLIEAGGAQWQFDVTAVDGADGLEKAEWLGVPCGEGRTGWVTSDEAAENDGVADYFTLGHGYGEAPDLSKDELARMREGRPRLAIME